MVYRAIDHHSGGEVALKASLGARQCNARLAGACPGRFLHSPATHWCPLQVMNVRDGKLAVPVKAVQREIQVASSIQHPHIVELLDFFAEGECLAIVVRAWMTARRSPHPPARAFLVLMSCPPPPRTPLIWPAVPPG